MPGSSVCMQHSKDLWATIDNWPKIKEPWTARTAVWGQKRRDPENRRRFFQTDMMQHDDAYGPPRCCASYKSRERPRAVSWARAWARSRTRLQRFAVIQHISYGSILVPLSSKDAVDDSPVRQMKEQMLVQQHLSGSVQTRFPPFWRDLR